jgi:uncharacterized protein (DUF697 family)
MTATTIDVESTVINDPKENRLDRAGEIIATATKWSVAAAFVPVPYLDLAALAGIQTNMVVKLSNAYGETISSESVRGIISVLLGTLLPANLASTTVSATAKFFPGFGSLIGVASLAAFGSAATYAVGKVFVRHFEHGGTVASFKAETVKEDLKAEFANVTEKS